MPFCWFCHEAAHISFLRYVPVVIELSVDTELLLEVGEKATTEVFEVEPDEVEESEPVVAMMKNKYT